MTTPPTAWTATGISWTRNQPALTAVDPSGTQRSRPLYLGAPIGLEAGGRRHCVGIWKPGSGRRQPCPFTTSIPATATTAQCSACADADTGHRLARDQMVDDGREYGLYLAWLGPGLLKVGLTATDRGSDRLAEQGALAYTWLTRAGLTAVRAMEKAIADSGIAAERYRRPTKLAAWGRLSDPGQHLTELRDAYARIGAVIPWPGGLLRQPCTPVDHTALFGLDHLPTGRVDEITELRPGARIAGSVRCLIGRELLLDTDDGPVLLNTRLLAGWPIQRATATRTSGTPRTSLDLSRSDDADTGQSALF
ncbi:DUF2797 domain-containing protein [Nocardia blacklockiae]|uniref:DUF2797 domain-containing protein n=1 Tax=Nocardia blacklockiae TaxID=480036 RepID=UPI001892D9C7|nr:DUF2797 domain-containing protein [Nocardia blacklockiae]MBF6175995.1 DUF2797 domain-containing protein [Nocardia blacklockiae]